MHKEKNFDFFFLNFIEETKTRKKLTTIESYIKKINESSYSIKGKKIFKRNL